MSVWKQGDTLPDMVIDCFDGSNRRADLTGATLTLIVTKKGVPVWERSVTGDANGKIVVPLQPQDTATPGTYFVKVRAVWPDGRRQHYPPGDEFMTMTVTR